MTGPIDKSPTAYRTISEVAMVVGAPQHVLRFWETRFPQIRPLKRGGNRRYYRPEDVALLQTINRLLYTEGYTIKGVQKLLAEAPPSDAMPFTGRVPTAPAVPPAARVSTAPVESVSPAPADAAPVAVHERTPLASLIAIRARLVDARAAVYAI